MNRQLRRDIKAMKDDLDAGLRLNAAEVGEVCARAVACRDCKDEDVLDRELCKAWYEFVTVAMSTQKWKDAKGRLEAHLAADDGAE